MQGVAPPTPGCRATHKHDRLGRSEHLDKDRPGPYWQLMALLGLITAIQKGDPSVLGDIGEVDPCAICLESPDEKGSMSEWLQLEPCRCAAKPFHTANV